MMSRREIPADKKRYFKVAGKKCVTAISDPLSYLIGQAIYCVILTLVVLVE